MVSQKEIKSYDFKNIYDYYEYIIESIINGQMLQSKKLIKKLSKAQKINALNYFEFNIESGELLNKLRQILGVNKL